MINLMANGDVYKGYAVSLSTVFSGYVELTDWNDYRSVAATVGIATNDAHHGDNVIIQQDGIYENLTWTFEYLKPVYVFASGTVTQNIPPKNVMKIGIAVSPTKLLLRISEFIQVTV